MPRKSVHKNTWKETQSRTKNKKTTKLAILVLSAIAALLIVGQMINLLHALLSPWKIDQKRNYTWDQNLAINLVIKNSTFDFLSYIPSDKKITIIHLPDNLIVDVPFGMGKWQLGSVYDLGETNKKGDGSYLIKQTVSTLLGVNVDGILEFRKGGFDDFRKDLNMITLLQNLKSDLTVWEILNLKLALSAASFDKVKKLNLEDLLVLDKGSLADGTKIYTYDPVKIDSIVSNITDPLIREEHKSIAVLNATEKPLLAQSASRLITNLGANVIIISNSNSKSNKSYILGGKSKTVDRLIQIFDKSKCSQDKSCVKISPNQLGVDIQRVEIVVVLGEDYLKK